VETSATVFLQIGIVILGFIVLSVQNRENTKSLRDRQDETNDHLEKLNDKTYKLHGRVSSAARGIAELPCRKGAPLPEECTEED
jgi:hypothetical protein